MKKKELTQEQKDIAELADALWEMTCIADSYDDNHPVVHSTFDLLSTKYKEYL